MTARAAPSRPGRRRQGIARLDGVVGALRAEAAREERERPHRKGAGGERAVIRQELLEPARRNPRAEAGEGDVGHEVTGFRREAEAGEGGFDARAQARQGRVGGDAEKETKDAESNSEPGCSSASAVCTGGGPEGYTYLTISCMWR